VCSSDLGFYATDHHSPSGQSSAKLEEKKEIPATKEATPKPVKTDPGEKADPGEKKE
jgi:hypothetical protein